MNYSSIILESLWRYHIANDPHELVIKGTPLFPSPVVSSQPSGVIVLVPSSALPSAHVEITNGSG